MNFKHIQKQAALEAEYRQQLIDNAVDLFDVIKEVQSRVYDNAVSTGSRIKTPDRAEAFKLVELALKAEEIKALSRIESSVDNV
jgi:hypothetical protein